LIKNREYAQASRVKKKEYLLDLQTKAQNLELENIQLKQQVQYLSSQVQQLTSENADLKVKLQRATQHHHQQQQTLPTSPTAATATDISVSIIGLSTFKEMPSSSVKKEECLSKSSPFSFFQSLTSFERPQLTSTDSSTLSVGDIGEPFKPKTYFLIFLFFFALCFFGRWGLHQTTPFSNKPMFLLSSTYEDRQHLGRTLQESYGSKDSAHILTDLNYNPFAHNRERSICDTALHSTATPTTMSAVLHDEMHMKQLNHHALIVSRPSEACLPHNSTVIV
jgi:hypothetical protein